MTLASWIDLQAMGDARGRLFVAESGRHIPFDIRRLYYLRDLKPDTPRGFHAHRVIEQVAVCVTGACDMVLDDGKSRETVRCDDPAKALYIGPMVWHEMWNFSSDCILLVFASAEYDEGDYIRDYAAFADTVAAGVGFTPKPMSEAR
jgi:dTDP-4-dehydrorhamnose 3,5-epimerase-like enzyme